MKETEEVLQVNPVPRETQFALSGLPGLGAVGAGAASLFLERSRIRPIVLKHLYAKSSHVNLLVSEKYVVAPSGYTMFYAEAGEEIPVLVLVGALQPTSPISQFNFAKLFLSTMKGMGISYVFTLGGYHSPGVGTRRKVYFVPNDFQTYKASLDLNFILAGGQISGAAGVIVGLSKYYGFRGGCLLAETTGEIPDRLASLILYESTIRLLNRLQKS